MTFAHPLWFWGLAVLPLFVVLHAVSDARRGRLVQQLVAPRLEARLAGSASSAKRWLRLILILLGITALLATLAQPRWGFETVEIKTRGRDVIIAVDVSRSMLANDLAPSRLARVKLAAEDLITSLKGDRIGLVAFAGTAFLQAPLTADTGAVLASLRELDTEIIPRGGTNIAEAIHTALDAFGKGESEDRAIVLYTDGEELDADGVKAAKDLQGSVRIFTVGAGSPDGSIIAFRGDRGQTDFVKDPDGQIVKSRLDEDRLRAIAEATGGFYIRLQSGPSEMEQIRRQGLMQLRAHDTESQSSRKEIERFQWPLSVAIFLLAASLLVGERRRSAALAALLLIVGPHPASAANSGLESYSRQDYAGAIQHFEGELKRLPKSDAIQFDLGAAAYKAGQLEKALEAFSNAIRSANPALREKAEYNLGNTLFQRGSLQKERPPKVQDWKNSLQHYEEALKTDPSDANAVYNRDVVRKLLEEEEKEQKKEDEKKEEEQKQSGQQQKDDKSKQDKQKQGGQDGKQNQEGGQGDQQPQQGGDSKEQKDGQPQDGKSGADDQKQQQQQGSEGEKGDQQKQGGKPSQEKDKGERGKKEGEEPDAQSDQGKEQGQEQKRSGPIEGTRKGEPKDAAQEQADAAEAERLAEELAAAEGKMTEAQARSLLDSLKNEDDRVRLLVPKNQFKDHSRMLRDW